MTDATWIALTAMTVSGATMAVGTLGPALGQAKAIAAAMGAIARQPDEAGSITRALFVGLAMIESMAIYCLVIAMILIFSNPFWHKAAEAAR
jgi:F-type H+-transporting ATPase subunit c